MIGLIIAIGLGAHGKWRWLGYVCLLDYAIDAAIGLARGSGDFPLWLIVLIPPFGVALGYGFGALWHRVRRGAWPRDRAIERMMSIRRGIDADGEETICWEVETPVLSRRGVGMLGTAAAILFVVAIVVLGPVAGGDFGRGIAIAAFACAGLAVLAAVAIHGVLFNRLRRSFVLAANTYSVAITDTRLFAGAIAACVAGIGQRRPALSSVSARVRTDQGRTRSWNEVRQADFDPHRCRIYLLLRRGGWFGRERLDCHPDGYPAASAWVARHVGHAGITNDAKSRTDAKMNVAI